MMVVRVLKDFESCTNSFTMYSTAAVNISGDLGICSKMEAILLDRQVNHWSMSYAEFQRVSSFYFNFKTLTIRSWSAVLPDCLKNLTIVFTLIIMIGFTIHLVLKFSLSLNSKCTSLLGINVPRQTETVPQVY